MSVEILHPYEYPHTLFSSPEEVQENLASGVLDAESAEHYQQKHDHLVETILRNPDGTIKAVRLSGNLRSNPGGDWQAVGMGGGVVFGASGIGSAASATALYASSAVNNFTASSAAGGLIFCGPNTAGTGPTVFGAIGNNSASCTYIPVDKWYSSASTIGLQTGATPNGTCTWQIISDGLPGRFLALSCTTGAGSSTDTTLPGEILTAGELGRAEATFAHTSLTAAASSSNSTLTSTYTLAKTFTASATITGIQKAAVFGSAVASTGPLIFTNTFSSVNMIANDTLAVTWTINC